MKVKVQFSEAQKWVTAQTTVEGDSEDKQHMEIAKRVFNEAQAFARTKSMEKLR